jgi:negative regulator of flagellin synthesis FlgM
MPLETNHLKDQSWGGRLALGVEFDMSIDGTQGTSPTRAVIHDIRKARSARKSAAAIRSADTTGTTNAARELARARESVEESPEVRSEKVKALKAAIADGTYEPDPEQIARKLLDRGL